MFTIFGNVFKRGDYRRLATYPITNISFVPEADGKINFTITAKKSKAEQLYIDMETYLRTQNLDVDPTEQLNFTISPVNNHNILTLCGNPEHILHMLQQMKFCDADTLKKLHNQPSFRDSSVAKRPE